MSNTRPNDSKRFAYIGVIATIMGIFASRKSAVAKSKLKGKPSDPRIGTTNINTIMSNRLRASNGVGRNQGKIRKQLRSNPHLRKSKKFKAYKKH